MSEQSTIPAPVAYLAQIPEYRQARGKRHPLLALLPPVCVALPRPALTAPPGVHPSVGAEPADAASAVPSGWTAPR